MQFKSCNEEPLPLSVRTFTTLTEYLKLFLTAPLGMKDIAYLMRRILAVCYERDNVPTNKIGAVRHAVFMGVRNLLYSSPY